MRLRDSFRDTDSLYSALRESEAFVQPVMEQGLNASDVFAVANKYNRSVNSFLERLSNKKTVAAAAFSLRLVDALGEAQEKGLTFAPDVLFPTLNDMRTKVWKGELNFSGRQDLFQAHLDDVDVLCRKLKVDYDELKQSFDGAEELLSLVHQYNGIGRSVRDVSDSVVENLTVYRATVLNRIVKDEPSLTCV